MRLQTEQAQQLQQYKDALSRQANDVRSYTDSLQAQSVALDVQQKRLALQFAQESANAQRLIAANESRALACERLNSRVNARI
jgi:hypothetical protein